MKTYTLDEVTDKYIGERGTDQREAFEGALALDFLGEAVGGVRKEQGNLH